MQTQDKSPTGSFRTSRAARSRQPFARSSPGAGYPGSTLAEQAKLSLSTLEKALGGRRPFTLATTVRLEQALGVSLRKGARRGDASGRKAMSRPTASAPMRIAR